MLNPKTYLIINPASAWGKTKKRRVGIISAFKDIYGHNFILHETTKPLEATQFVRTVIEDNAELIVCVGGDGTINEVVNGFYRNSKLINENCRLGIISSGTGQGFAQSVGIPKNLKEQILRIKSGTEISLDVGKVTYYLINGRKKERFFVNEFQIGIGGTVVKNAESNSKLLGGFVAFGYTTIKTSLKHPNQKISLSINGKKPITNSFVGIVIANGQFTGGGMKLAPYAKPNDKILDILMIYGQSKVERLMNFSKVYSGTHINSKKFEMQKGTHVELTSDEKVLIEADGELLGNLPCTVELLPSQIRVC